MSEKSTIEIGKEILTDSAITTTIKAKFLKDSFFKAKNIHVVTEKGIVTLSGELSSSTETNQAVEIATKTDGVKKVISKIQIDKK